MKRASARDRPLGVGLVVLATAMAVTATAGPFGLGVLRYRTSATTLHQIIGGDAVILAVVAPITALIGVLVLRGNRTTTRLAVAPTIFAAYTYSQLIVGNEYLRVPGNVERWFALLLAIVVLAAALATRAWQTTQPPDLSPRVRRTAGTLLLFVAAFVVVGLHARGYVDAVRDRPTQVQYLSSPTAFWLVKFMDLAIVVPAAVAVGVGLLRGRAWAGTAAVAVLGGYTLLAASVTGMAVTMATGHDPDASTGVLVGACLATVALAVATAFVTLAPGRHDHTITRGRST